MSKWILITALLLLFTGTVYAQDWTAPLPPDPAMDLMPEEADSFWEGLHEIIQNALPNVLPSISECFGTCTRVFAVVMLLSILQALPGSSPKVVDLAGVVAISILLLRPTNSLIALGSETVRSITEYGKVLLPVMTAALAGSGGPTTSAALYAGTTFFNAILASISSVALIPMIYIFLGIAASRTAIGDASLKKISDLLKWLMTWILKLVLYVFTGYISITGVISGSTDAAALKATKLTISGMVPVVGGILSDASEAVLVGAELVRNSAGIYGLLASVALCVGPFLQIGIQYLLLKCTVAVCGIFGNKQCIGLIEDFTWAMGILLAMTGAGCLLVIVSVICFMKGVG